MSLREFQRAFAELVEKPDRWTHPDLGLYRLTSRERAQLTAIFESPGMSTNLLLVRVNRLLPIHAALPRTCAWLGPCLRSEFDAFLATSREISMQVRREAWRFGVWLFERIEAGVLPHGPLEDVLRFELAAFSLMSGPDIERIIPFRYDPSEVLSRVSAAEPLPEKVWLRLRREGASLDVMVVTLSAPGARQFDDIGLPTVAQ